MKKCVLISGLLLGISSTIFAAPVGPCGTGTLASFISLGSMGCSVGDLQFFGFSSLTPPPGSTALTPGAITVMPSLTGGPGLLFTLNASSSSLLIQDARIGFDATPLMGATNLISDSTLTQNGGTATGTGGVTGVETICIGAAIGGTGTCPGTPASRNLGTFAIAGFSQTTDNLVFGPTALAGIVGDFSAGGGGANGTASVTSFAVNLSEVAAPAVPEPATILLTGCALLGLGFGRRLYSRRAGR